MRIAFDHKRRPSPQSMPPSSSHKPGWWNATQTQSPIFGGWCIRRDCCSKQRCHSLQPKHILNHPKCEEDYLLNKIGKSHTLFCFSFETRRLPSWAAKCKPPKLIATPVADTGQSFTRAICLIIPSAEQISQARISYTIPITTSPPT